jgi:hypothetical protein
LSDPKYGTVWDDDDLRRAMRAAPDTYRGVMAPALAMMLQETRKELAAKSPGRGGGEGNLASSWQVIRQGPLLGAVRAGVPYAYYVDQGRGPGKMPPYDPIELWVHRMGFGVRATGREREERRERHVSTEPRKPRAPRKPRKSRKSNDELDREGLIYMIRRKIGAKGTEPTGFVEKARAAAEPRLERIYLDAVDAFVAAVSTS